MTTRWCKKYDDMFISFDTIPACEGQETDRRTPCDRIVICIASRSKKRGKKWLADWCMLTKGLAGQFVSLTLTVDTGQVHGSTWSPSFDVYWTMDVLAARPVTKPAFSKSRKYFLRFPKLSLGRYDNTAWSWFFILEKSEAYVKNFCGCGPWRIHIFCASFSENGL